jgi:RNA polymerase sigma factor for flagellar operon FliA
MRTTKEVTEHDLSEAELWSRYGRDRGMEERNALLVRYMPLVKRIAKRIARRVPREVLLEDLEQVGSVGLLKGIEAYDPSRGVPFPCYASRRIHGAILDELRAADWVPRKVRRRARAEALAAGAPEAADGREPVSYDVQTTMKPTPELGRRWAAASKVVSLLTMSSLTVDLGRDPRAVETENCWQDHQSPDPCEVAIRNEVIDTLHTELSERQMTLLRLHYFEHRPCRDIAQHFGVSERRVYEMRAEIIRRLGTSANRSDRGRAARRPVASGGRTRR